MTRIVTIRWWNDVCSCVILYDFDADLPLDQRTYTVNKVETKCNIHEVLGSDANIFDCVHNKEGIRYAKFRQVLVDNVPLSWVDLDTDGTTRLKLKDDITIGYSFTGTVPNRVLNIVVGGSVTLTQNQKNNINNRLTQRFGANAVIVV